MQAAFEGGKAACTLKYGRHLLPDTLPDLR